tara:strand:+ start:21527 stop:22636 length:1110 start_codon:yes stop_codon:yes gene_type:complete
LGSGKCIVIANDYFPRQPLAYYFTVFRIEQFYTLVMLAIHNLNCCWSKDILGKKLVYKENPNIPKNPMYSVKNRKKLKMKTTKTYSESIRHKYIRDKKSGNLRGEIYKLTPANIRKLCLNLILEELSHSDKIIMNNFFEIKDFDDIRGQIKQFDIDGFRPICKFLREENDSIASHDALELITILIDYFPRPYKKYRNKNLIESTQLKEEDKSVAYFLNSESGKSEVIVKPKNKKLFAWFSNASAFNKILVFSCILLLSIPVILTTKDVLNNRVKWMVWQVDHYEEVEFDDEKYNINQLKYYKEDRIKYFNKVDPICEYKFFNEDGSVRIWYGKNKNKVLEYFTDYGLHPETGKTLKPISKYMIDKYICN